MLGSTLQELWSHLLEGARSGALDDPQTHISWTALDLDPAGHEEVAELIHATLKRALAIQAEAAGRLAKLPEDERASQRTELSMLCYQRPRQDD